MCSAVGVAIFIPPTVLDVVRKLTLRCFGAEGVQREREKEREPEQVHSVSVAIFIPSTVPGAWSFLCDNACGFRCGCSCFCVWVFVVALVVVSSSVLCGLLSVCLFITNLVALPEGRVWCYEMRVPTAMAHRTNIHTRVRSKAEPKPTQRQVRCRGQE